jgi:hypothetical protein
MKEKRMIYHEERKEENYGLKYFLFHYLKTDKKEKNNQITF